MGGTHTLLAPSIIAKEALMHLENHMVMGNLVHRQYRKEFVKVGGTISIRKPVKFNVSKTRIRVTSTVSEQSISLQVATQAHVSWAFHSVDLTLTIDEYANRYIAPAAAALANTVDADLTALYDDVWNSVWESTGFVDPESFIVLGKAARKMDEEAAPPDNRVIVLNPAANWSLANALKSLYVESVAGPAVKQGLAKSGKRKGYFAEVAGYSVYMDQNIKAHQTGNWTSTGDSASINLATSAGQFGSTAGENTERKHVEFVDMEIKGSLILLTGDVFTVAGCFAVNPVSGESTGQLRQFVVTADASVSTVTTASGEVTVYFEPEMLATGPYKTIDTIPAVNAVVTLVGTQGEPFPQSLAFHKNAFALVTVPLEMPINVWGARETHNGLSIRLVKQYDITNDYEVCRLDILYGVKTLYPELACRIWGAEG